MIMRHMAATARRAVPAVLSSCSSSSVLQPAWCWGGSSFPSSSTPRKQQPLDFNHALHVEEVDEGCESCHFFREDGSFSGIPKLAQCTECHEEPMGETEDEAIFVEQYVAKEREVPWLSYSRQPDCVFFSHAAHVIGAKMDCVTCHGHIGESEYPAPTNTTGSPATAGTSGAKTSPDSRKTAGTA